MKKIFFTTLTTLLAVVILTSCGEYNKLMKSTDYEYKYEAAKVYFADGKYTKASTLLMELITILKGSGNAEEALYMLGMCYYNMGDMQGAAQCFNQYISVYPRGTFAELSRFYIGKALYLILTTDDNERRYVFEVNSDSVTFKRKESVVHSFFTEEEVPDGAKFMLQ